MLNGRVLASLLVLVGFAGFTWVAGGSDVVVQRGEREHVFKSWPEGASKIVNDCCRTIGWKP